MKDRIITCLLPFIISTLTIYYISGDPKTKKYFFDSQQMNDTLAAQVRAIANFSENKAYERSFLKSTASAETIFLLGSSELTASTPAIPYNFISQHFKTQVMGVGHAGNQCFSIYTQLLAKEHLLKNAPISIILSPGWFESKASKGTSSEVFLEFNSEHFLNNILKNKTTDSFHDYLYTRVAMLFPELNAPSLEIKLMNFYHQASKSFIHQLMYAPLIFCDRELLKIKEKITGTAPEMNVYNRLPIVAESVFINWDSLLAFSKAAVNRQATNNSMGIANDYYTEHIHGKTGHVTVVNEKYNQELKDFKMLIRLLHEKKVNASFIISPLNTLYYKNLPALSPTISEIEDELKKYQFPYLNLLKTDTSKYDKAILHDVMHLSDYGWYHVNKFLIDTYHLSK